MMLSPVKTQVAREGSLRSSSFIRGPSFLQGEKWMKHDLSFRV